ncbi:ankyrin repeat domain-containing protein [Burkholderia contaminans]|uniref:ankyrin repeat domain-containing protein n=1 Tax=Burkholderia contaminans TaxID=488447 RepID=UPI001588789C|nr:ankyrin repeat domain-containing protein [Burkholderia contaminans]
MNTIQIIVWTANVVLAIGLVLYSIYNPQQIPIKEIIYWNKFKKLRDAADKSDLKAIQELQASGFNINEDEHLVLREAARNGNLELVKLTVENSASIPAQQEALLSATCEGYLPIVEYLIDSDISIRQGFTIKTPYQGYELIVSQLLIISALRGHFHISQYLVSKGHDIKSVLLYCQMNNSSSFIVRDDNSISLGFSVSRKERESAMDWARRYINAKEMAEKLNNDLQPKTTTKTGRTKI